MNITSADEFNKIIAENPLVLVMFGSNSCAPCRLLLPQLEKIPDIKLLIIKAETFDSPNLFTLYAKKMPTTYLFKNGLIYTNPVLGVNLDNIKGMVAVACETFKRFEQRKLKLGISTKSLI